MAKIKIGELRNMTDEELRQSTLKIGEELYAMRCDQQVGRLEKSSRIRTSRKSIARINTILKERKIEKK